MTQKAIADFVAGLGEKSLHSPNYFLTKGCRRRCIGLCIGCGLT